MDNQRILRLLRYILAGITFIFLFRIFLMPIDEPDFFWHMATGRWIVEHLSLPTHDPFSYTTPALLSSREHFILTSYWLSQILYYGIYYVSGWNGFILLRFIILGALVCFVYKRAKGSDRTVLFSIVAVALIVFAQIYALERPQVFSFVFFAILLYLLDRQVKVMVTKPVSVTVNGNVKDEYVTVRRNGHRNPNLFLLPLLMLLWANMHGGYILGQVVILVYLLSEGLKFLHPSLRPMEWASYKRFLITGISGILSALINPNTYKAITEMWGMSKSSSMGYIAEYQSTITSFKEFFTYYIPVYWLLLLIAVLILLYRIMRKRFDIQDIVMLAGLGYFSFTKLRYVAFFLIWATPFISLSLTSMMQGFEVSIPSIQNNKTIKKPLLRYVCIILSFLIIVILMTKQIEFRNVKSITSFKTGQWVSESYPEDAVRFIKENNINGNMFNHYDWGGYLIWRFYPGKKVFIDGRNLYEFLYSQWSGIINATLEPKVAGIPCYKAIIESYRVRYMLIPLFTWRGELPIMGEMIKDKEWVLVYFSGNAMIFVKNTPENYNVIKAYAIPKDVFNEKLSEILSEIVKSHR